MAVSTNSFNSEGGFGVKQTVVITEDYDIQNVNSFSLQNTEYSSDCVRTDFILKGFDSSILSASQLQNIYIPVQRETINFLTANIIATNENATGSYTLKLEATVSSNASGDISTLGKLFTVIKENVPSQETWSVDVYDSGNADQLSLVTSVGAAASTVTWFAHVQVISVSY